MEVQNKPTDWNRLGCIALQTTAAAFVISAAVVAIWAVARNFSSSGVPIQGAPTRLTNVVPFSEAEELARFYTDTDAVTNLEHYLTAEFDFKLIELADMNRYDFAGMTRPEIIAKLNAESVNYRGQVGKFADYLLMEPRQLSQLRRVRGTEIKDLYHKVIESGYSEKVLNQAAYEMIGGWQANWGNWHWPLQDAPIYWS